MGSQADLTSLNKEERGSWKPIENNETGILWSFFLCTVVFIVGKLISLIIFLTWPGVSLDILLSAPICPEQTQMHVWMAEFSYIVLIQNF